MARLRGQLGLQIEVQSTMLPVSGAKRTPRRAEITTIRAEHISPVKLVSEAGEDITQVRSWMTWTRDALRTKKASEFVLFRASKNLEERMNKLLEYLKQAFRQNLRGSKWQPLSSGRLARRALWKELGKGYMPVDRHSFYDDSLMERVINNFKVKKIESEKSVAYEISARMPTKTHPDFTGWHTSYKGPNQVLFSMMGLKVRNNPGRSSTGSMMMIPLAVWSTPTLTKYYYTKRDGKHAYSYRWYDPKIGEFHAVMKDGKAIYPSKMTEQFSPSGVPVMFVKQIDTSLINRSHIQNPLSAKGRVIFWAYDNNNRLYFPKNVALAIKRSGLLGTRHVAVSKLFKRVLP